jgi:hypothetical protein
MATVALIIGFVTVSNPSGVIIVTFFCGLWLISFHNSWKWGNPLGFVGFITIASLGTWMEISLIWLLIGFTGALIGWNLSDLLSQEKIADRLDNLVQLERVHLIRITVISVIGITLSLLATTINIQITFAWALLLGIILVFALGRTIGYFKNLPKQ